MPTLTADERIEYVRAILETFQRVFHVTRQMSNSEWCMARKWAERGIPLATVLQGIIETGGRPRRLEACERSVEANIRRWHSALGSLTELPKSGPLEPAEPVSVDRGK